MTALRRAVAWATTLACPWTSQDIANLAGNDLAAVRNYLSRLAHDGVLALQAPDLYQAGPGAPAWRKIKPKTKQGGGARAYREAKATRDKLAQADWQARRAGAPTTPADGQRLTGHTVPDEAGLCHTVTNDAKGDQMHPITDVAVMLGVSRRTVWRLLRERKLAAYKVGGQVRIAADDVKTYLASARR